MFVDCFAYLCSRDRNQKTVGTAVPLTLADSKSRPISPIFHS